MILDRRPGLALVVGGSVLAGGAAVLVARPFWHPMFTPDVLAGAVVGVGLVVVPVVLGRVSRAVRMMYGSAVMGGGAVLMAITLLAPLLRPGPYTVRDSTDVAFLGTLGGLVAGGGTVLAATAVLLLREAGVRHVGWAEERGGDGSSGRYVAVCSCGWQGSRRRDPSEALCEAGDHAGAIRPVVRSQEDGTGHTATG